MRLEKIPRIGFSIYLVLHALRIIRSSLKLFSMFSGSGKNIFDLYQVHQEMLNISVKNEEFKRSCSGTNAPCVETFRLKNPYLCICGWYMMFCRGFTIVIRVSDDMIPSRRDVYLLIHPSLTIFCTYRWRLQSPPDDTSECSGLNIVIAMKELCV